MDKQIFNLEKELNVFLQYNRRESIEISGVPENIPQRELESTMILILRRIGLQHLSSYEIAACHRLRGKKTGGKRDVL